MFCVNCQLLCIWLLWWDCVYAYAQHAVWWMNCDNIFLDCCILQRVIFLFMFGCTAMKNDFILWPSYSSCSFSIQFLFQQLWRHEDDALFESLGNKWKYVVEHRDVNDFKFVGERNKFCCFNQNIEEVLFPHKKTHIRMITWIAVVWKKWKEWLPLNSDINLRSFSLFSICGNSKETFQSSPLSGWSIVVILEN